MRSNAFINIKNDDKYCFIWSILASLNLCENDHSNRVSNYKQYFDELNIEGFNYSNGFNCGDVQKFEKLNVLSFNLFDLNSYQKKIKGKHNWIPFPISKIESDRVVDLLIYTTHYGLIEKLNVFFRRSSQKLY